MTLLRAENLAYGFGNDAPLFSNLSCTLGERITGIVGPNGAGKSLLAHLLVGHLKPLEGTVTCSASVGFLKQINREDGSLENKTLCDFLNMRPKIEALMRVERGVPRDQDFEIIGDDWLLIDDMKTSLQELGLPSDPFMPCALLSGGQLTRLCLHQLFKGGSSYLILDEPSNHLDASGKVWLLEHMKSFKGGILVITHDRDILAHVHDIFELTPLGFRYYGGNFQVFSAQKTQENLAQERAIEQAKSHIKQLERSLQDSREKAQKRTSQGKKVARSGSQAPVLLGAKKNAAEKSRGTQESHQGRVLEGLQHSLAALEKNYISSKPQTFFLTSSGKRASRVLDVANVRLPHGTSELITFFVNYGNRVHIAGPNGSGKSTLMKIISGTLMPCEGTVSATARVCYLDQHFSILNTTESARDNLAYHCPHLSDTELRTLLAGIGLRRERADQHVGGLSGGERMKVAMLAMSNQPGDTLLLLDEPDNHLDLDSKRLLAEALNTFMGTLIVVSHDTHFIKDLVITNHVVLE
jgi:ATPase subunit of ABC transporter with duplicated ATPase domains